METKIARISLCLDPVFWGFRPMAFVDSVDRNLWSYPAACATGNGEHAHYWGHRLLSQTPHEYDELICDGWIDDEWRHWSCDGQLSEPLVVNITVDTTYQNTGCAIGGLVASIEPANLKNISFNYSIAKSDGLTDGPKIHQAAHDYLDQHGLKLGACPGYIGNDGLIVPCRSLDSYPLKCSLEIKELHYNQGWHSPIVGLNTPPGMHVRKSLVWGAPTLGVAHRDSLARLTGWRENMELIEA